MRGYNQQKESINSNPQEPFLTKKIEDYTIKDCEDLLAKYPKDIDADKVRKRLERLRPQVEETHKNNCSKDINKFTLQECDEFLENNPNSPDAYKVMKRKTQILAKRATPHRNQEWHETILGKLCLTALLLFAWFVLAGILTKFGMSVATGFGHFVLLGIGYSGMKAIWNRD